MPGPLGPPNFVEQLRALEELQDARRAELAAQQGLLDDRAKIGGAAPVHGIPLPAAERVIAGVITG